MEVLYSNVYSADWIGQQLLLIFLKISEKYNFRSDIALRPRNAYIHQ